APPLRAQRARTPAPRRARPRPRRSPRCRSLRRTSCGRMRYFGPERNTRDSVFQAMANAAELEQQLIAGWRAIERNDPGAAEAIAADLLRRRPAHPEVSVLAYNLLGVSLMQQSRHQEALAALASALERGPGSAGTHLNLGSALTELGRHAEAIPHLRRAAEI